MSLLDAILATASAIWSFISMPGMVAFYGVFTIGAGAGFAYGMATHQDSGPAPRIIGPLLGAAVVIFGVSVIVWAVSSESPWGWS